MDHNKITDKVYYVGVDDTELDLFEGQYVIPNGISYNSYLIMDEKTAVLDTVDRRKFSEWMEKLTELLPQNGPDYLIISHLEPDHSANIEKLALKYLDMKLVGSEKAFAMFPQFFDIEISRRFIVVKEGDTLDLGSHELSFYMAPMVHWPEVMVTYDRKDKILFSADGFGKFGALLADEDWTCEARRYYFNICGKYGRQVQALLKKAAGLDIAIICPLHGPVLTENLGFYIDKYDIWSSYQAEDDGVLVAYASIHGNTKQAVASLVEMLKKQGAKKVAVADLSRDDMAEAVEDAFRYDKLILAGASYDGGVFPCMEDFLHHLKAKNYQQRKVGLIQNTSWAPAAGRVMRELLEAMKDIHLCDTMVTIKTRLDPDSTKEMEQLVHEIL